ncbi:hypothetical protein A6R68_07526, partial [Neotoma lepida]
MAAVKRAILLRLRQGSAVLGPCARESCVRCGCTSSYRRPAAGPTRRSVIQLLLRDHRNCGSTASTSDSRLGLSKHGTLLARNFELSWPSVAPASGVRSRGMITIPAASLAGAQIVQTGANTNTTSSEQGTVTVILPVAGNVVNSGGMVMMVPRAGSVPALQRIPLPGVEMLEEEPLPCSKVCTLICAVGINYRLGRRFLR